MDMAQISLHFWKMLLWRSKQWVKMPSHVTHLTNAGSSDYLSRVFSVLIGSNIIQISQALWSEVCHGGSLVIRRILLKTDMGVGSFTKEHLAYFIISLQLPTLLVPGFQNKWQKIIILLKTLLSILGLSYLNCQLKINQGQTVLLQKSSQMRTNGGPEQNQRLWTQEESLELDLGSTPSFCFSPQN